MRERSCGSWDSSPEGEGSNHDCGSHSRTELSLDEFTVRVWHDLGDRLHGPMTFRLILQPVMATFLAVRAGWRDGREGKMPFLWGLVHDPAHRRGMLVSGWRDVWRVFLLGIGMDVVYQFIVLRWFYPGEALIVAFVLAIIPYLLLRGIVMRVVRWSVHGRAPPRPRSPGDTK